MKIKLLTCLCVPTTIMATPLILTSCNDEPVKSDTIPLEFLFIKNNELYGLTCPWNDPRIAHCTKLFIPKNVVTVVENAFANMGPQIKTIEFEDAGEDDPYPYPLFISEQSFLNSKVEEIILPSRLTYVGPKAFKNCRSVKKLDLSAWSELNGKSFIDNNPFVEANIFDGWSTEGGKIVYPEGCEVNDPDIYFILKGTSMPETWMTAPTLTDVSDDTFEMSEVYKHETGTEVYLTGLKDGATITGDTVVIPSKVTIIAPLALDEDFALPYSRENPKLTLKFDDNPQNPQIKKIQAAAFYADDNIKAIDLSNCGYLNQIGAYAFANCSLGYELMPTPDDKDLVKMPEGVNNLATIGIGAFYSNQINTLNLATCTYLKELSASICKNNLSLSWVMTPSEVTSIGPMALQDTIGNYRDNANVCYDWIDSRVDYVGYRAFCRSTANIIKIDGDLSEDTPKLISEECFYKSKHVNELIICNAVQTVLDRAFAGLESLQKIDVSNFGTVPNVGWASTAFEESANGVAVKISQATDETHWKTFFKEHGVEEDVLATWTFNN